jgi:hypothetical protein
MVMIASEELKLSDWANWVTQDKNGVITEWEVKPTTEFLGWYGDGRYNEIECSCRPNLEWEDAIVNVDEWKPCMKDGILWFRGWGMKPHDELLSDYLAKVWASDIDETSFEKETMKKINERLQQVATQQYSNFVLNELRSPDSLAPDVEKILTDPMSKPSNWRKTLTPASSEEYEGKEDRVEDHPLYPIFMRVIEYTMRGKGERHGGCSVPFLDQPWNHYAKLHGRGFLTGQASKKLEEAASIKEGKAFVNEVLGAITYAGMSILNEEERMKDE